MTKQQAIQYYENFFVSEYSLNHELLEKYNAAFAEVERDMGLEPGSIPKWSYNDFTQKLRKAIDNLLPNNYSKFKPEHLDIIILSIIITHIREHLSQ